eukprot:CAMPEP_0183292134 /NCGR_PEP_ID=MMETSP0160_2-20130417/1310_1 /TAXON_ID=2839 ORGANISM="Odontella Sinensis, Strain Grunow 1884" /NCGR_SAMPLE_ID=MMETSP0160_2 /ASSEMBLY_ACC=CAM_ASM_000250 /LENGTH=362 /DNA_ID=CAMNT_0025453049 /DNA_START=387 /DNA_END=1475 /DNA_ORIENTATION=-
MLEGLWSLSMEVDTYSVSKGSRVEGSTSCVVAFLDSLRTILVDSEKVLSQKESGRGVGHKAPPATVRDIRNLILDQCLFDLSRGNKGESHDALMQTHRKSFYMCLQAMPMSYLEEKSVFAFVPSQSFDISLARFNIIAYLTSRGYFKGQTGIKAEIQKAMEWLARQKLSASKEENTPVSKLDALRQAAFNGATSAASLKPTSQRDILFHLMEVLLVEGDQNICLELMSFLVYFWRKEIKPGPKNNFLNLEKMDALSALPALHYNQKDREQWQKLDVSPKTLREVSVLLQEDMCSNLAIISANLGISGAVTNRAMRIMHSDLEKAQSREILRQIVTSCLDLKSNEALAISLLSSDISGLGSQT